MRQNLKRILSALLCLALLLSILPLSGMAADIYDENIEFEEEIEIPPLTGVSVSGSISSSSAKGTTYVELWNEVPYQLAYSLSTEEDTYIFEGVEPGTYTMVARKASCVLFSETVTVEYTPVTQNVKLRSPGDVNGDGRINVSDISSIYAHVKGTRKLTGYELACANVNDGPLDIVDVAMVYAHIQGTKKIEPRNSILPEDIFVKTVDDFRGYEVVQLDGQKDANFVVYSEDVQKVTSSANTNVLLSRDDDNLIYTFVNPDDTMKALKVGDVFYTMPATSDTAGISAKIRKIVFMGNAVTVYSDPVDMDDLFLYVDVEELDLSGTAQERRSASGATETHIGDILFQLPLEFSMGGNNVTANLGCVVGGRLTDMVFGMKYSAKDLYFSYEFTGDLVITPEFNFGFEGTIKGEKEKELGSYPIPAIPGLKLTPSLVGTVQVSGTLEGTWNMEMVYDFGIRFDTHQGLKRWFNPVSTTYGDVKLEMDGALTLGAGFKLGLGIIGIWQAYVQADISWTAEGELVKPEDGVSADAVHTCEKCIDGKCHFDVTVKVGMEAKGLLKKLKLDLDLSMGLLAFENLSPKDFYCSFRPEGDVEFGWDECPYKSAKLYIVIDHYTDIDTDIPLVGPEEEIRLLENTAAALKVRYPDAIILHSEEDISVAEKPGVAMLTLKLDSEYIYFDKGDQKGFGGASIGMSVVVCANGSSIIDLYKCTATYGQDYDDLYINFSAQLFELERIYLRRYDAENKLLYSYNSGYKSIPDAFEVTSCITMLSETRAEAFKIWNTMVSEVYPYLDLWVTGDWNENVEQLIP